jgi:tetratricopeptide (TPR) repeat protein
LSRLRHTGVGLVLLLASGCAYHNAIFNADGLFERAEVDRRAGRDGEAIAGYNDVVRKAGEGYRARPGADWAGHALLLLARSHFWLGNYSAAVAAFAALEALQPDSPVHSEVDLYRGLLAERLGDPVAALEQVNRALDRGLPEGPRVEAHLLRARVLLTGDQPDVALWDLDRAIELDPAVRTEAGLERLRLALLTGDRRRSARALDILLADPRASTRADTILALLDRADARWGPARAASLLAGVDSSRWARTPRGRIALARARFLDRAGETDGAVKEALGVAAGLGLSAAEARLLLAQWRVERARDLAEVSMARALLLPAGSDPRVAERLAAMTRLEQLVGLGLVEPLGLFAAGEVARDQLNAPYVARGLFLAYADQAPSEPWAPKALLAALTASAEEGDRAWIRGRLEAYTDSPYVLAALGGPATDFAALEEELDVRLRELEGR